MGKSKNIVWHPPIVTRHDRAVLNKHRSVSLWFTGLSGSGKSTLAHALEVRLYQMGMKTFVLDGDNVRHGLCSDIGFSDDDRSENIRRIAQVSKLFVEAGVISLAAFISPFANDRAKVRSIFAEGEFYEVYCRCSVATCESRDVKGLYRRARAGEIANFTGISSRFEEPAAPELVINTEDLDVSASVGMILKRLLADGLVDEQRRTARTLRIDAGPITP